MKSYANIDARIKANKARGGQRGKPSRLMLPTETTGKTLPRNRQVEINFARVVRHFGAKAYDYNFLQSNGYGRLFDQILKGEGGWELVVSSPIVLSELIYGYLWPDFWMEGSITKGFGSRAEMTLGYQVELLSAAYVRRLIKIFGTWWDVATNVFVCPWDEKYCPFQSASKAELVSEFLCVEEIYEMEKYPGTVDSLLAPDGIFWKIAGEKFGSIQKFFDKVWEERRKRRSWTDNYMLSEKVQHDRLRETFGCGYERAYLDMAARIEQVCGYEALHDRQSLARYGLSGFWYEAGSKKGYKQFKKLYDLPVDHWAPSRERKIQPYKVHELLTASEAASVWKQIYDQEGEACMTQEFVTKNKLATLQKKVAKEYGGWKTFWKSVGCSQSVKPKRDISEIIRILKSLGDGLSALTPREIFILFQQQTQGQLDDQDKEVIDGLTDGSIVPGDLIECFDAESLGFKEPDTAAIVRRAKRRTEERKIEVQDQTGVNFDEIELDEILNPSAAGALSLLDSDVWAADDHAAIEALIASATDKIWNAAFKDEAAAVAEVRQYDAKNAFIDEVRKSFLEIYDAAKAMPLPAGYRAAHQPRLMQRVVAVTAEIRRRLLVLSGMGLGKTLSSQLAVRNAGCRNVLVVAPNNTVGQWATSIERDWDDVEVLERTFRPTFATDDCHFLVLNFETFSHITLGDCQRLLERMPIDAIVVDEVQMAKQRREVESSKRRKMLTYLIAAAGQRDPNLVVLGMSGTPVVNDLMEGRKLIEMVFSEQRDDLGTDRKRSHAMRMFQEFVSRGVRQRQIDNLPAKKVETVVIRADDLTPQMQRLRYFRAGLAAYEQLVFDVKIPTLVELAKDQPTVIATQFTTGIVEPLRDALQRAGLRVSVFTGDLKEANTLDQSDALSEFIAGATDVLIGSIKCIGTGIDGLQTRSSRLVYATLPWTHADRAQLEARQHRPQMLNPLEIFYVQVVMEYRSHGGVSDFNYCERRRSALNAKQALADCAVDGKLPTDDTNLSPRKAQEFVEGWLDRLIAEGLYSQPVQLLQVPLQFNSAVEELEARRDYGHLSQCHDRWCAQNSSTTHAEMVANPQLWQLYHTDREESRKAWEVDPLDRVVRFFRQSSGLTIGDFGCGTARLARELAGRHTVHSFDHVAINEDVKSCDVGEGVPLDDGTLDAVVFCLSLWGRNWRDYLVEARRCLKPITGQLIVWSPLSSNADVADAVRSSGFELVRNEAVYKWRHLRAVCHTNQFTDASSTELLNVKEAA